MAVSYYQQHRPREATVAVSLSPDFSGDFVCPGAADDVTINAAIVFVGAMGGGLVHLGNCPTGVTYYDITASIIDAGYDNIILEGEGWNTVFRLADASDLSVILLSECSNWVIRDLAIDGNKANQTGNANNIEVASSDNIIIRDVHSYDAYYIAIYTSRGTRLEISNNLVSNSLRGIYMYKTDLASVVDNWVDDCDDYGIVGTTDTEVIHIINNFVVDCLDGSGYGIEILNAGPYSLIMGNYVYNCNINIFVSGSNLIRVIGNYSELSGIGGIALDASDYCTVSANICYFNGRMGIKLLSTTHCSVTGNTCINNGQKEDVNLQSGIWLDYSTNNTLSANVCTDDQGTKTQTYGIREFSDNCNHNLVTSNELTGNLTGGLSLIGTGTKAKDNKVDGANVIGANVIIHSAPFQFIQGTTFISADGSAKGWEINAEADMAIALGQLPLEVQQVIRIKIWAVALGAPAGAGGQMHLDVLFNAGGSLEAWNLAANSWTLANFDGEEADYVNTNVIHWMIEDGDVGDELINLLGGDSLELKVNGGTAAAPDGATNATFRVIEIEYI